MKLLLWKADWRVLLLALAVGGMLATLSVARYRGYNVGMWEDRVVGEDGMLVLPVHAGE